MACIYVAQIEMYKSVYNRPGLRKLQHPLKYGQQTKIEVRFLASAKAVRYQCDQGSAKWEFGESSVRKHTPTVFFVLRLVPPAFWDTSEDDICCFQLRAHVDDQFGPMQSGLGSP